MSNRLETVLRSTLRAAEMFEMYATTHNERGSSEKAQRNETMGALMRTASELLTLELKERGANMPPLSKDTMFGHIYLVNSYPHATIAARAVKLIASEMMYVDLTRDGEIDKLRGLIPKTLRKVIFARRPPEQMRDRVQDIAQMMGFRMYNIEDYVL